MYIAPNSTVWLFRGYPGDKNYNNIPLFANADALYNHMAGLTKKSFDNVSYQRQERGVFYCPAGIGEIVNVNYMMFKNTNYENKWFYAFVTGVEYVNNKTTRVSFEIDEFNTWYYSCSLQQCFVEREHTLVDNVGSNLVPDNLELGEYVFNGQGVFTGLNKPVSINADGSMPDGWGIYVVSMYDSTGSILANGTAYGNIYSGLNLILCASIQQANKVIQNHANEGNLEGIVSIFMAPRDFDEPVSGFGPRRYDTTLPITFDNINGYTPKNKKLFTYPYNFLYVTNFKGGVASFKYEYFSDPAHPSFAMEGALNPDCEFILSPISYKGSAGVNYNESMSLKGLPMCGVATDTYRAWLAQNQPAMETTMRNTAINLAATGALTALTGGAAAPALIGGIASAATTASSMLGQKQAAKEAPDHLVGSNQSNIMYSVGNFTFQYYKCSIRKEMAQRIDEYWSAFGYPIGRVKKPNTTGRPQWNYVKTSGCCIKGGVPADSLIVLEQIFDKGVTFWHNYNNVGNYSLDNGV